MPQGTEKGSLLGSRYRLRSMLGSGGMASVWLAQDERLDRRVAVKVLSDNLASDMGYVRRFRREARVAARLSHPNLVQIFDYSGREERPYLVMEHVDGPSLAELMKKRGGRHPDPERVTRELLDALAHIHAAGVIHRDVKPGNVLIGPDGRPRLTDFGIAQPEDATQITKTGDVIGTMPYIAPEIAEGKSATVRSDLYSLGVLLREYTGGAAPSTLAPLIERLTASNPSRRPRSAAAALSVFDTGPGAQQQPAAASSPTATTRQMAAGAVASQRGRRAVIATLVVAALGVPLVAALAGGGTEEPAAPAPPARTVTTTVTQQAPAPPAPKPKKPCKEDKKGHGKGDCPTADEDGDD